LNKYLAGLAGLVGFYDASLLPALPRSLPFPPWPPKKQNRNRAGVFFQKKWVFFCVGANGKRHNGKNVTRRYNGKTVVRLFGERPSFGELLLCAIAAVAYSRQNG
jgi:hypothetical protein